MIKSVYYYIYIILSLSILSPTYCKRDKHKDKEKETSPPIPDGTTCTLIIPDNPLGASGLATPYELVGCSMENIDERSFVQATIFDIDTAQFYVYNPLVINFGLKPAIPPVEPVLPRHSIVGIWFGTNADTLILQNELGLKIGNCVNGAENSPFGQFAYCNAINFFQTVTQHLYRINHPLLGIAVDGYLCPTSRDYYIVDADPADNLQTTYLLLQGGQTAQDTAANRERLDGLFTVLVNPSDERLLSDIIAPIMKCETWKGIDIIDNQTLLGSLALNEIHAAMCQTNPALIPALNPMVLDNDGNININKLNLYRVGVYQQPVNFAEEASTAIFCQGMLRPGLARIRVNQDLLEDNPSPDKLAALNLYLFLLTRWSNSYETLLCQNLINIANPVELIMEGNLVIDAVINANQFIGL